ncbi:bactofilin family protein [Teichococcus aestuarii]|uniref:bactofilin family protein n=1 Tax=Teichococcus aestuarii TaxID=568898 RepID=UPI003613ACE0
MPERLEPKMDRSKPTPIGSPAGVMLVAADSEVEGRLRSRGVVRVEGVLRGNLHAPVLLIEAGGLMEGSVTAERVRVCGALRGTVTAREIEIVRTAMIDAELSYEEISIERGARVSGVHKQRDPEPAPPAPASVAAQPPSQQPLQQAEASPETAPPKAGGTVVLATAAASTAALVAEAEAALHSLAQATQAAAEAVADLADEGVTDLVKLEAELRATPQTMLVGKPAP